ncbi:eukaryotic translation initiation factor 3 subunit K [Nilaparvata lugens]|uniref:eukaryotic translation initiation factor 3 subunit K n=1 Tax=Nilaparvata lugens TaxID=108931 RepID=UPI000B985E75|nr:eukaryotic translation initiation factor 3 subunit K [Nilaparvata lugens]
MDGSMSEEAKRQTVATMLKGIERYNPSRLDMLEQYVRKQIVDNSYDLEANLAVLQLYRFNKNFEVDITCKILLKALTNFPHTDFILCKCLLTQTLCQDPRIQGIIELANYLECCRFQEFWEKVNSLKDSTINSITGFHDSIRKFVCHVVSITYQTINAGELAEMLGNIDNLTLRQWVKKYGWEETSNGLIFIANQDDNIKTKNISEKIEFDSVVDIMASSMKKPA